MYASSLSGLNAARTILDVSAHNIANANTEGFQPQRVELRAREGLGGVDATITQAPPPPPTAPGISGTDLPAEMVGVFIAMHAYDAHAHLLNTLLERDRYLLDLLA